MPSTASRARANLGTRAATADNWAPAVAALPIS
jgi:hypothetical protein